jgi:hypothetical protein
LSQETPGPLRFILNVAAEILVAIYVVLNGIVGPLFGPIMRGLSRLKLIQRIEQTIAGLPPYLILVLLVVPFGIAELAKVYALLLMAEDHFRTGLTIFIGAYVVSILVCERTFHAGKAQLMTIGWFKSLFDWVMAVKERVLGWFRETRIWRMSADMRRRLSDMVRRVRLRILSTFGAKPKGSFERR